MRVLPRERGQSSREGIKAGVMKGSKQAKAMERISFFLIKRCCKKRGYISLLGGIGLREKKGSKHFKGVTSG